ncbi:MAG TPA: maltose alpha-D-glucosyltransferase, partial [Methylomirabilota bacterium]|nr:maltose alpha-D-glucosyltransferase [Methylomirabilota bacterium]
AEMHARLMGPAAPYNLEASNGISCTSATVAAAALGIRDLGHITEAQRRDIQRAHLLLALFNAMQPGVFALSGWDLVGALTLPGDAVGSLIAEGDTRWINRGAYDLLGKHAGVTTSSTGLPRARALYGPLPEQLQRPDSFASQLRRLLHVRRQYRIDQSEQVALPSVRAPGLVVMVHRLPGSAGIQVTALNFARTPVRESVAIEPAPAGGAVTDLLAEKPHGRLGAGKRLPLTLGPHEGQVLLIR